MAPSPKPAPPARTHLRLPASGTRDKRPNVFCKVLTRVSTKKPAGLAFEGKSYRPGESIAIAEFGDNPTVLECAGAIVGKWSPRGHNRREVLWILWSYDSRTEEWVEVARAQSIDSSWSDAILPVAVRCLEPKPGLYDVRKRVRDVSDEIVASIDQRLDLVHEELHVEVLTIVYDRIAGRIVNCA